MSTLDFFITYFFHEDIKKDKVGLQIVRTFETVPEGTMHKLLSLHLFWGGFASFSQGCFHFFWPTSGE